MLEAMTYQDMLSDINKNARKNGIINDTKIGRASCRERV